MSAAASDAATTSTFLVRELFGFSFSTWRQHPRGESTGSVHDGEGVQKPADLLAGSRPSAMLAGVVPSIGCPSAAGPFM